LHCELDHKIQFMEASSFSDQKVIHAYCNKFSTCSNHLTINSIIQLNSIISLTTK
jgi:hypothetical protein